MLWSDSRYREVSTKKTRSKEGVLEGREGEKGFSAARKVPINMEITSSSPVLRGSLMARQKENGFSSYYSA